MLRMDMPWGGGTVKISQGRHGSFKSTTLPYADLRPTGLGKKISTGYPETKFGYYILLPPPYPPPHIRIRHITPYNPFYTPYLLLVLDLPPGQLTIDKLHQHVEE